MPSALLLSGGKQALAPTPYKVLALVGVTKHHNLRHLEPRGADVLSSFVDLVGCLKLKSASVPPAKSIPKFSPLVATSVHDAMTKSALTESNGFERLRKLYRVPGLKNSIVIPLNAHLLGVTTAIHFLED